jgi:hypothetical protein
LAQHATLSELKLVELGSFPYKGIKEKVPIIEASTGVCMRICVCVCVCVCAYVYVYVCVYVNTYTHTHTHTGVLSLRQHPRLRVKEEGEEKKAVRVVCTYLYLDAYECVGHWQQNIHTQILSLSLTHIHSSPKAR